MPKLWPASLNVGGWSQATNDACYAIHYQKNTECKSKLTHDGLEPFLKDNLNLQVFYYFKIILFVCLFVQGLDRSIASRIESLFAEFPYKSIILFKNWKHPIDSDKTVWHHPTR